MMKSQTELYRPTSLIHCCKIVLMFRTYGIRQEILRIINNKIMNKEQKIDEAMNWWYDISDHQTTELIMKHKLRKPIKEQDIVKLFALYGASKTKLTK